VSKSTVSLVVQGSSRVKPETKAVVQASMAAVGYVYNRAAAQMRGAATGLVGLVINDLRNPYFTEFATSVQMTLSARGYAVVLANTGEDAATQDQVVASMIEHGVAGMILSPAFGDVGPTLKRIAKAGQPAMQVLRQVAPEGELPFMAPDYRAGGRAAAEHVLSRGVTRVGFVGGVPARSVTRERREGALEVFKAAGITPQVFDAPPTRAVGYDLARELDATPDTALLCFNDLVALGLSAGLSARGLRAGRDVCVVGFDDIEEAGLADPPLSSVGTQIARFGESVAGTLLDWLECATEPPSVTRTEVALIARESSLT
jgi:LacI family transcriptional regulator